MNSRRSASTIQARPILRRCSACGRRRGFRDCRGTWQTCREGSAILGECQPIPAAGSQPTSRINSWRWLDGLVHSRRSDPLDCGCYLKGLHAILHAELEYRSETGRCVGQKTERNTRINRFRGYFVLLQQRVALVPASVRSPNRAIAGGFFAKSSICPNLLAERQPPQ